MGTPMFAVPILKSLYQNGFPINLVYTQPPQKSHRGQRINKSPVQGISETLNIEFRSPQNLKNNTEEYEFLKKMDADLAINRWHGEGTSNTYPSSAGLRKVWNQKLSDFWVEEGDFFRIQNIQFGYTIESPSLPETRLYFTAERPFTFFDYNGFDPEVSNGVDRQTYPIPSVYTIGLNIKI